jgi:hypothetical protein
MRRSARARAAEWPSRLRRARGPLLRLSALAGLACLAVLGLAEVEELRGELAFARFLHLRATAELALEARRPEESARAVQQASAEAELILLFGQGNAEALNVLAETCISWSAEQHLDPMLRLRAAERAVTAAALAVRAAPSDWSPWLRLARALAALGLTRRANVCLERACELAPPGSRPDIVLAEG